jgi:hypothetical protein
MYEQWICASNERKGGFSARVGGCVRSDIESEQNAAAKSEAPANWGAMQKINREAIAAAPTAVASTAAAPYPYPR